MPTDETARTDQPYTVPEAAELLRIPRSTMYEYVARGLVEPAFRLGRSIRIPKWWVDDLLAGRAQLPEAVGV